LIEMTAKMSKAEFNIKSRLNPLKVMVEQIGPFTIGNELILSEKNGMQKFSIERLEFKESKNKVFLSYYFSYNL
jgi:hypothetical protein